MDDSESEEELLIFADFKDEKIATQGGQHVFKTIGMDTEMPLIQLNNYIYKGNYQDCIGTNLFMENDTKPIDADPIFGEQIEQPLKYVCKTRKHLNLEKIFLKPKCEQPSDATPTEDVSAAISNQPQASSLREAIDNIESHITQRSFHPDICFTPENIKIDKEYSMAKKHVKRKTSFTDEYDS